MHRARSSRLVLVPRSSALVATRAYPGPMKVVGQQREEGHSETHLAEGVFVGPGREMR